MNHPPRHKRSTLPVPALALTVLCAFFLLAEQASAHGVYIFAWTDGPRICTRSYFSKSSKVMGGDVSMADGLGAVLGTGRTDDAGIFCFAPPREAGDLTFTVNAGQGHRAEYLLPAADVRQTIEASQRERGDAGNPDARPEAPAAENATPSGEAPGPTAAPAPATSVGSVDSAGQGFSPAARDELRAMIRQEIRQELAPLRQEMVAERGGDASPGLRGVLGGLGWIFGLAAAGALYYNRRKGN